MATLKLSFVLVVSFFFIGFYPQDNDLNLGFERAGYKAKPMDWYAGGGGNKNDLDGYIAQVDDKVVHNGKYSLHLKYVKGEGFGVGTTGIDVDRVRGKVIRYSGWIKTKSVGGEEGKNFNGYAGLWWRVDGPNKKTLAFNNMQDSLINGTRDWQHFSFELPVGQTATNINFGVLMAGGGEAWFDGLTIDTNGVRFLGED